MGADRLRGKKRPYHKECTNKITCEKGTSKALHHHKRHDQTACFCPECNLCLADTAASQHHVVASHSKTKRFMCRIEGCGKWFSRSTNRIRHEAGHMAQEPNFQCPECRRGFTLIGNRDRHVREVHPKTTGSHRCDHCGKTFHHERSMHKHMNNIHG